MLIDTHAHLYDEKFENIDKVIEDSKSNNVDFVICSAADLESSKMAFELSQKYSNVYCTIGIHPHSAKDYTLEFEDFARRVYKNKKVLSIGEIGLDYYYDLSDRETQREVFEKQIKLADELGLPITIHTRDATEDTIKILKKNQEFINNKGIIHCFGGSLETANEYFKLGFAISVGGSITFKNADRLRSVIQQIPIDKICLETDCPYLAPVPLRGTVNEPKNIKIIAKYLAEIKQMRYEDIEDITTKVAQKYYRIGEK